jgi:hypothetical protein
VEQASTVLGPRQKIALASDNAMQCRFQGSAQAHPLILVVGAVRPTRSSLTATNQQVGGIVRVMYFEGLASPYLRPHLLEPPRF